MEEKNKPTYEQLEAALNQLYGKMQEMNMVNAFKRLDYLFKILEFPTMFSTAFLDKVSREIETIIDIPEETPEKDNGDK